MSLNVFKSQSGIAALLTVVIIGAAALIMARSASLLGIGEADMAYTLEKGERTSAMAEGCVEEILRRFQLDPNYAAIDFVLPVGNGQCTVNTEANGNQRTIIVLGNLDEYYKNIQVDITINNEQIIIDNWQELSD